MGDKNRNKDAGATVVSRPSKVSKLSVVSAMSTMSQRMVDLQPATDNIDTAPGASIDTGSKQLE